MHYFYSLGENMQLVDSALSTAETRSSFPHKHFHYFSPSPLLSILTAKCLLKGTEELDEYETKENI